eukprot:m.46442 g.46442  ORF g.46442 m.46442 type:complete len:175 (+) comp13151_c0_seq2:702-1226(+)
MPLYRGAALFSLARQCLKSPTILRSLSTQASQSFIERAKLQGANALLGAFTSKGGFDAVFKDNMTIIAIKDGHVTVDVCIEPSLLNSYGTIHGGATSTLVDIVGTLALLSRDATKPGVTVELSTSYTSSAKAGDSLRVEGKVLKMGRRLGFTQVEIFRSSDDALVATGRHTKAL